MSKEREIQEAIISKLTSRDIYPFSVVFTYSGGDINGMLGITFYLQDDLDELLEILDYNTQCDKSGFWINRKDNTVILTGMALINLYTIL